MQISSRGKEKRGKVKFSFFSKNTCFKDWEKIAAYFDPYRKINRFRAIGGNTYNRVRISNYSIIRIDSKDDYDLWYEWAKILGKKPLYWRADQIGKQEVQDGFGQTFGAPKFSIVNF